MKISNREKIMLIVLLLAALFMGYYKFVYSGKVERIAQLQNEKEKNQKEIEKLKDNVKKQKELEKEIKVTNAKIFESTYEFFPVLNEEKIIVILDDMIKRVGIANSSISLSESGIEEISLENAKDNTEEFIPKELIGEYNIIDNNETNGNESNKNTQKLKKNIKKSKKVSSAVEKMTVGFDFKGSYKQVLDFVDGITEYNKKILIKSINFSAAEGNGVTEGENVSSTISGNMIIEFYALPKFLPEEGDTEYLKWDFDREYGKINPFKFNSSGKVSEEAASENGEAAKRYDVSLTVRPISSDLPTVMIGNEDDETLKTFLFADNSGIENIEIYFTKVDGKYYYKYKTQDYSYPKNFNGNGALLNLKDKEINIAAYSMARNSNEDIAGVNIKINNSTDKNVNVEIFADDKERKRVTVIKEKGNIKVNNK